LLSEKFNKPVVFLNPDTYNNLIFPMKISSLLQILFLCHLQLQVVEGARVRHRRSRKSKQKEAVQLANDAKDANDANDVSDVNDIPLEETNVAMMNSDEARDARHAAATKEDAWNSVGNEAGIWVWRIEQFKVVAWPKDKYGKFHEGDCYIVLQADEDKDSGKLSRNVFFWLGEKAKVAERGTAAYKTVELSDYFKGEPTQHREVMGVESVQFRSLFDEIDYLEGGVATGFNPLAPVMHRKTLFIVRKLGNGEVCKSPAAHEFKARNAEYCVMELQMATSSLNHGDCFVLDAGLDISHWCGEESSPFTKYGAAMVAASVSDTKINAKIRKLDKNEFVALLGGSANDIQAPIKSLDALPQPVLGAGVLYELSNDADESADMSKLNLVEKGRGDLTKSMLNSDKVILVDTDSEIFLWIGKGASETERRGAWRTATTYLDVNNKSPDTAVHLFKEGKPISNEQWNKIFEK
jgi:gelsolin